MKKEIVKEDVTKLNDFGKHPGYRKKPMNLPEPTEVAPNGARDWNDDSAKSTEPFGKQIGSSAPYDEKVVNILTDAVFNELKLKGIVKEMVDEKNFLRLPNNNPAPMPPAPDMSSPDAMAGPDGTADAGMMPDDPSMMEPGQAPGEEGADNPFGKDFDAGIEADEDTDPENYIQQLTGKLTQVLRDYDENNQGNNDLDKYVLGMVIKQCIKGMSEEDRRDMIKKIKETPLPGEENTEDEMDAMNPGEETGGEMAPEGPEPESEMPIKEIKSFKLTKRQAMKLFENLNDNADKQEPKSEKKFDVNMKINKRTKPFVAPGFKS